MKQFHNPRHEKIAEKALDGHRLMEGENPESTEIEDAIHWSGVYGELITFKQRLLAQMRSGLPSLPSVAAAEVRSIDMGITEKQMERYQSRRAFWEQRSKDLVGKRPRAAR